jgi:signal peptidase II
MYAITMLISAALVAAIDQFAKSCIVTRLTPTGILVGGRIGLRTVINTRTRNGRPAYWIALLALEAVWLASLVQLVPAFQNAVASSAIGAALGGAGGNVLDRIYRNGVVDYIDVGFWPVFNLADVAIVLGVALTVLTL